MCHVSTTYFSISHVADRNKNLPPIWHGIVVIGYRTPPMLSGSPFCSLWILKPVFVPGPIVNPFKTQRISHWNDLTSLLRNARTEMDSSSSSSSPAPASKVHLALAAFFGASVMAISAFYLHKRSIDQALDRIIKLLRNQRPLSSAASVLESGTDDEGEADDVHDRGSHHSLPKTVAQNEDDCCYDEKMLRKYRVSSSMPNARLSNDWMDEDAKLDRPLQYGDKAFSAELMELNTVPSGLPPLRTDNRDGRFPYLNSRIECFLLVLWKILLLFQLKLEMIMCCVSINKTDDSLVVHINFNSKETVGIHRGVLLVLWKILLLILLKLEMTMYCVSINKTDNNLMAYINYNSK